MTLPILSGIYQYSNLTVMSWSYRSNALDNDTAIKRIATLDCKEGDNLVDVIPGQIETFADYLTDLLWDGARFVYVDRVRGNQFVLRQATIYDTLMQIAGPTYENLRKSGKVLRHGDIPSFFEFFPYEIMVEKPKYFNAIGYISDVGICHIEENRGNFQHSARGIKTVGYLPEEFDVFYVRMLYQRREHFGSVALSKLPYTKDCAIICPKNDPVEDSRALDNWLGVSRQLSFNIATRTPKQCVDIFEAAKPFALQFGFANDPTLKRCLRKLDAMGVWNRMTDLCTSVSTERVSFARMFGNPNGSGNYSIAPPTEEHHSWATRKF